MVSTNLYKLSLAIESKTKPTVKCDSDHSQKQLFDKRNNNNNNRKKKKGNIKQKQKQKQKIPFNE